MRSSLSNEALFVVLKCTASLSSKHVERRLEWYIAFSLLRIRIREGIGGKLSAKGDIGEVGDKGEPLKFLEGEEGVKLSILSSLDSDSIRALLGFSLIRFMPHTW